MAKRRREPDSNDKTTATAEYNTVFVDTSLDTHLAMLVCNSDTVSDFKKKLVAEHMQCFPKIGEIQILSLKVKRRGNFYHLPDIMLVWSAFHGVKRNWFLLADASGSPVCHLNLTSSELGTSNGVKMDMRNVDDNYRCLSSDVNRTETLPPSLPDDVTEKNVVPEMIDGLKVEKHLEKTIDFQSNNYTEENRVGTEFCAKKKLKMRHAEDVCHNPSLKDSFTLSHASGKDTSIPEIIGCDNSTVDVVKEGPERMTLYEQQGKPTMSEAIAQVSGVRNDQSDIADRVAFEGTSAHGTAGKSKSGSTVDSQNLLGSERRKEDTMLENTIPENSMASKLQSALSQDGPTEHSGGVSIKVPDLPAGLTDADGAIGDINSDRNKKKKKKVQKTAAKIQGTTDMEQTRKGESIKPYTETHKSEKQEEEKSLSLNHDHEVIMPSNSKASDHADPDLVLKEASFSQHLLDANAVTEPEISSGSMKKNKKKKREKKSADTDLQKSGIEQTDNGVSGSSSLLCPSTYHIPEKTDKAESISDHKEKDVQMKLLDSSTKDASEKTLGEADFVTLPQTKQTLEDVITGDKKERKTKSSAGNCLTDFPAVEKENKIVEFNPVEKEGGNAENKDKKAKKKRKKRELTASGVQERHLPVRDQKDGVKGLTADENLMSVINSEQEGRHVASSQVLSPKSEEKPEDMHGSAVNTDDPARTSENDGEGINFRQHAVPGQYQDKVDSSDKVEKVTKSNEQLRTRKKVKVNGLPSVSISTESQKSLKSYENKGSEHKSRITKDGGRRQGDSAQNSDWNEAIGKKRKKRELTASGVQERHLPVRDQKDGVEGLTADENLMSVINSEQEGRHVASSQVLSPKSEEKPEDMHGSAVNTDDPARTSENDGEGINFRQHAVPGQYQDKVDSSDKVEKVTKSNEQLRTRKKVKVNGLPSVSISTESQKSLKSYENKGSEHKSRITKDGDRRQGDSAQNSDWNEAIGKKRKKRELTASDVQEHLPVQDQKDGVEVLTADENLMSVINSEQEGRHVASSQVLSPKSEEKPEDMHGSAVNTDDPARTSENDGEGINFRQHVVPGQYQDKVDSSDKVEKVTKSNEQLRTRKKVKVNGLPSVSISTESQKSLKSYENKGSEHKSRITKDGGRRQGDSAQNSDWNEAIGKKRKKRELTASDIQEHLPVKDQKVGVEILTADEDSSSFINSGQEGKHVASSQVLSRKSGEKLEDMHGSALNTNDLARTSENEDEGINFKQYFVLGQYEDKVDSSDKVEKVTKSNEEIKTQKKVKVNGSPSLSISTEIQHPLRSYENKGSEIESRFGKDGSRRQGNSAQNSDQNEVIPNSSRGSLRVSENGVKYSSPTEVKNPSLDKSSLERSQTFPEKKGNKRSQSGLNVMDKMVMKTPQKKIVLTKPGGIFQASSGESSADENGTSHSDASTHSPSDSSSLSGSSVGESDLSQDSTRNGSNDVNGRSTGSKNMSKLDLSAAKDVTMDMILKSSKRFKKAKLQASQNELDDSQQMELVPDSQPINP